jgi:hypothetical protein
LLIVTDDLNHGFPVQTTLASYVSQQEEALIENPAKPCVIEPDWGTQRQAQKPFWFRVGKFWHVFLSTLIFFGMVLSYQHVQMKLSILSRSHGLPAA